MTQFVRELERAGYAVRKTKGGHWVVRVAGRNVVMPSSPSDWRSMRNARAELRRAGVEL